MDGIIRTERYIIIDRDGWIDVREETNDATKYRNLPVITAWQPTGCVWSCDNMEQAVGVAERLRTGRSPWDGPSVLLVDDPAEETFWRRIAMAGEWDEDMPIPF